MGFLSLKRREGQTIRLTIDAGVNTEKLLMHLLRDGITVTVSEIERHKVSVAIEAPPEVLILRQELIIN